MNKHAQAADDRSQSRRISFVFAALSASLLLTSKSAAQSLNEALVSAYLTNPALEAQRSALKATDELLPQALAGWRPTLAVDAETGLSRIDSSFGDGDISTNAISLTLTQNLYQGGETTANISRAELLVRTERARLGAVEQDVLVDTVTAYVGLFTSTRVLELARQNEARLKKQLVATTDRFTVGEVTKTDIAQAEARLAGAVADRIQAEGAILAAEATFRNVIKLEPEALVQPGPLGSMPAGEEEAQTLALSTNPNIVLADANLAASREDVRIAVASLLPSLDLEGTLSHADEPSITLDRQSEASATLRLRVPLYQGGGEYAVVRQNKRIVDQRLADLDAARRAVREGVTSAWQALMTARSTKDSIKQQVRAATIALEGTRRESEVGERTVLDVLDQESDLFQAEVDLASAIGDEVVAGYQLQAAIGQLNIAALELNVEAFDPEPHYQRARNRWSGLDD
ncbi:MAG: TolC family outer membrane protein [Geminicoccaceae bacterium]